MKKLLSIVILLIVLFPSCKKQASRDFSSLKNQTISKIPIDDDTLSVKALMSNSGLKGLSVAVFEDYKVVWTDVWGVKYDTVPLDLNTAFSTASISKPITATLFAILEEKNLINLKEPVNKYLKRWKLPENDYTKNVKVTLEHLLSHTAGTTQHGFADFYEGDTIPTILESVQGNLPRYNEEIEVIFEPSSNWKYSGGGYTIAMMAIEDHLGRSLADLIQEHILTPLKLQYTTMKQPNEKGFLNNVAKAHDGKGNIVGTGIPITPQVSASGLWSTPTDMAAILIEIQKALNGLETKVISQGVAERVTDIVTLKVMRGWSLGWERRYGFGNLDWFSHNGANTGIGGDVFATMNGGNGMVIFGNGPNSIRIPIINKLRDNIIKTHKWGFKYNWENKEELSGLLISKIIGRYQDLTYGEAFEIKEQEGKLYIPRFWNGVRNDLIYVGDNSFITNEVPGKFKMIFSDNNVQIEYSRGSDVSPETMYERIYGKLPYEIVLDGDYKSALKAYQDLKLKIPHHFMVSENQLNSFGYQQLGKDKIEIALMIFKINTELYPNSANTYDSLGEAYMLKGDKINAIKFYKKSLEINPNNTNAEKMLNQIGNY